MPYACIAREWSVCFRVMGDNTLNTQENGGLKVYIPVKDFCLVAIAASRLKVRWWTFFIKLLLSSKLKRGYVLL